MTFDEWYEGYVLNGALPGAETCWKAGAAVERLRYEAVVDAAWALVRPFAAWVKPPELERLVAALAALDPVNAS